MHIQPTIQIESQIQYLESESDPSANRYVFAYTIPIRTRGTEAARLLSRHWVITDADGKAQEVRGAGVIGETPRIAPGGAFRYTSATQIATPVGSMGGEYLMRTDGGDLFEAPIPPFTLAIPRILH